MVQLVRMLTQARRGAESMRHTTHKASPHTTAQGCAADAADDDDEGVHPHTDTLLMQPSTVSLQCNTLLPILTPPASFYCPTYTVYVRFVTFGKTVSIHSVSGCIAANVNINSILGNVSRRGVKD